MKWNGEEMLTAECKGCWRKTEIKSLTRSLSKTMRFFFIAVV